MCYIMFTLFLFLSNVAAKYLTAELVWSNISYSIISSTVKAEGGGWFLGADLAYKRSPQIFNWDSIKALGRPLQKLNLLHLT